MEIRGRNARDRSMPRKGMTQVSSKVWPGRMLGFAERGEFQLVIPAKAGTQT